MGASSLHTAKRIESTLYDLLSETLYFAYLVVGSIFFWHSLHDALDTAFQSEPPLFQMVVNP
jgi:hypothetical protein